MPRQIELTDVSFHYEGGAPVIREARFSVGRGDVVAIVSGTGGGKSTLLKLCAGLVRPSSGNVSHDGACFWDLPMAAQNDTRRRIGFFFQEAALISNMTVFDNLALPLRYHGMMPKKERNERISSWLSRLGLSEHRDHLPAALSKGLQRKVAFIRSELMGAGFYIWDEPTQGADTNMRQEIRLVLEEKKKAHAGMIIATRERKIISEAANRVVIIKNGAVKYFPSVDEGLKAAGSLSPAVLSE